MTGQTVLSQVAAYGIVPVIAIENAEAAIPLADALLSYLKVPTVAAVGGTWIAKKEDLAAGQWKEIRDRCKAALEIAKKARG